MKKDKNTKRQKDKRTKGHIASWGKPEGRRRHRACPRWQPSPLPSNPQPPARLSHPHLRNCKDWSIMMLKAGDAGDAGVETDLQLDGWVREHSVTASLVGSSVIGAPTYSLLSKCCSDHLTRYHQFFDKQINFSYFIQFRINISVALTLDIYNVLFQLIVELGIDNVSIKFKGRVHRKMR